MRLSAKSRLFLDLALILGLETLEGILYLPTLYRHGAGGKESDFDKRLESLRQNGYLTPASPAPDHDANAWIGALTSDALDKIADSIDPSAYWDAPWDGKWRLFAFDLIKARSGQRQALRNWLQHRRFGRLQGSLWVSPRPLENWADEIAQLGVGPQSAIAAACDFLGNATPESIVARAWNLSEINLRYQRYLDFLDASLPSAPQDFPAWRASESHLWTAAHSIDPHLPRDLWPTTFAKDYLGPAALVRRRQSYIDLAKALNPKPD